MQNSRYPKIYIRSRNELAKHISHKRFPAKESLALIKDVMQNFDKYWKDSKRSEPLKEKYVRSAKGTPLGSLLERINNMVLAPHDSLLPPFIFGGVKGLNHVKAARHLLGKKRRRVLIKLDIQRFFEQINSDHVIYFFQDRCRCSLKASRLLSSLCCVPVGPKGNGSTKKTIGRGFATSSRLAVWCNLDTFIGLNYLVQRRLRGKDARIAIYVDDIGITAAGVTKEEMKELAIEVGQYLKNAAPNQPLAINDKKTDVMTHTEGMEHLGQRMNRNSLSIGSKTRSKLDHIKMKMNATSSPEEKNNLRRKYDGIKRYKKYVDNATIENRKRLPISKDGSQSTSINQ